MNQTERVFRQPPNESCSRCRNDLIMKKILCVYSVLPSISFWGERGPKNACRMLFSDAEQFRLCCSESFTREKSFCVPVLHRWKRVEQEVAPGPVPKVATLDDECVCRSKCPAATIFLHECPLFCERLVIVVGGVMGRNVRRLG